MKAGLTIGELAGMVEVSAKAIRYYEEVGLLPRPRRSEAGYRLYSSEDVGRVRLIRRSRLLGLSLPETKEIVAYATERRCPDLHRHLVSLLAAKVEQVDRKVEELLALRRELQGYRDELSRCVTREAEAKVCPPGEPCVCMD